MKMILFMGLVYDRCLRLGALKSHLQRPCDATTLSIGFESGTHPSCRSDYETRLGLSEQPQDTCFLLQFFTLLLPFVVAVVMHLRGNSSQMIKYSFQSSSLIYLLNFISFFVFCAIWRAYQEGYKESRDYIITLYTFDPRKKNSETTHIGIARSRCLFNVSQNGR